MVGGRAASAPGQEIWGYQVGVPAMEAEAT